MNDFFHLLLLFLDLLVANSGLKVRQVFIVYSKDFGCHFKVIVKTLIGDLLVYLSFHSILGDQLLIQIFQLQLHIIQLNELETDELLKFVNYSLVGVLNGYLHEVCK